MNKLYDEQVKNNIRQSWKTINNVIGRAQKQSQTDRFKVTSGTIITDSNEISNEFNDFCKHRPNITFKDSKYRKTIL